MTHPLHSYGGLLGSVSGGTVPGVKVGPLSGWLGTTQWRRRRAGETKQKDQRKEEGEELTNKGPF